MGLDSLPWVPSTPTHQVLGGSVSKRKGMDLGCPGVCPLSRTPLACSLGGWGKGPGNASEFGRGWPVQSEVQEAGGPGTQGAEFWREGTAKTHFHPPPLQTSRSLTEAGPHHQEPLTRQE